MSASQVLSKDHVSPRDDKGQLYTHTIEAELLGSLPRQVCRKPLTIAIRWALGILLAGFFSVMVVMGQRDLKNWDALLQHGKTVQATVTGKYTTTDNEGTHYSLTYSFRTADGFDRSGSMAVDHATYDRAKAGDPATKVTYLPSSQGLIWQDGIVTAPRKTMRKRLWIVEAISTASIVCLWIGICEWIWKRQLRLLQNGVAVIGQVVQGKVKDGPKGQTYYDLIYQFPLGNETVRRTVRVKKSLYQKYTQGNPFLTVLYDPSKPRIAQPYLLLNSVRIASH